jgi:hypothetical protein
MCVLLPLLEAVDTLHIFAQKANVFVSDFVVAFKVTEGQLFSLYVDRGMNFSSDEFCPSGASWIVRMSPSIRDGLRIQLVFVVDDHKIWAQHDQLPVTRCVFQDLVDTVKAKCTSKSSSLYDLQVLQFLVSWLSCFRFALLLLLLLFMCRPFNAHCSCCKYG